MNKILAALTKKRGTKQGKLPTKRSMNLYIKVKDGNSWQVFVPLAIFLALVVLCIYRLGVVDRLNKLNSLQQENSRLEAQLNTLNEQLKSYDDLEQEYRRYTTAYLREEEQGLLSRTAVFDMLNECTEGIANITNISIQGNQVGLNVNGMVSLEDIDIIQDRLKDMPNVDEIKLSNAGGVNSVDVQGYIVFTVKEADAASEGEAGSNNTSTSYGTTVDTAEIAARLQQYTDAAADARAAKEVAAAGNTGSNVNASAGSTSGAASGAGKASAAQSSATSQNTVSTAASGSAASGSASGASVQNINGDEVVVLPEGVSIYGFDTLEQGQAQLQGGGN